MSTKSRGLFQANKGGVILVVGLLVSFAVLVAGTLRTSTVDAQSNGPFTFVDETDQASGVRYWASYLDGQINGNVSIDSGNADNFRKYLEFTERQTQEVLASGQNAVYALVVFNRPLSQEELQQFVNTYDLQPLSFSLRALAPNGMRSTINGMPGDNSLVAPEILGLVAKDIYERDGSLITGWIELTTEAQSSELAKLVNDPAVAVVDSTETLLRYNITAATLSDAGANKQTIDGFANDQLRIQMSHVPVYWSLEDFGLLPISK